KFRDIPLTTLKLSDQGLLQFANQNCNLLSGSVHYWRLKPELWGEILLKSRQLGVHFVCSYVPWVVHETKRGHFDFTGSRDLARFCRLAAEAGLHVLLRPGPHINAELTGFGFPDYVLNDPEIMARGPQGSP